MNSHKKWTNGGCFVVLYMWMIVLFVSTSPFWWAKYWWLPKVAFFWEILRNNFQRYIDTSSARARASMSTSGYGVRVSGPLLFLLFLLFKVKESTSLPDRCPCNDFYPYHAKALLEQTCKWQKGENRRGIAVASQSQRFGHWESRAGYGSIWHWSRKARILVLTRCFTCHMRGLTMCGAHSHLGEVAN